MIVFVAGMQRSGSTFSFNIIRELLMKRGSVYQEPCPHVINVVERSNHTNHILFKAHTTDDLTLRLVEAGAVKVVCTVRRPEDAVASWMETFDFNLNDSIDQMHQWLAMFARLESYALLIRYEDIDLQPLRAAWRIGRYVCPDAHALELFRVANKYAKKNVKSMANKIEESGSNTEHINFSFYDKSTFFHRRHVSTLNSRPAAERIGNEAVAIIRKKLTPFVDARGDIILASKRTLIPKT